MEMTKTKVTSGGQTGTTPVVRSATEIARTVSSRHLRVSELAEYCQVAESTLKELETKIQSIALAKSEFEKVKAQYTKRNVINIHNYESLLQAKNQLYKYKCELKSEFVTLQRSLKSKKLKFDKTLSAYEFEWQKNMDLYNSNSVVVELHKIQEENLNLEKETEKVVKLTENSVSEYDEMERTLESTFTAKILEFSKEMIRYRDNLKKLDEIRLAREGEKNSSRRGMLIFASKTKPSNSADDMETDDLSPVDISEFDDLPIPTETLENQNDEEMSVLMMLDELGYKKNREGEKSDEKNSSKSSLALERTSSPKSLREDGSADVVEANSKRGMETSEKGTELSEGESQYFKLLQQQQQQQQRQHPGVQEQQTNPKVVDSTWNQNENVETTGTQNGQPEVGIRRREGSDVSGRFEQRFDWYPMNKDGGEKQVTHSDVEGNGDSRSAFSDSSEPVSMALSPENINECSASPVPTQAFAPVGKPDGTTTDDGNAGFKSFTGFFTMGNDKNSETPSIFKLF